MIQNINKLFPVMLLMLLSNTTCHAGEPSLQTTLDWLKKILPLYTQENRNDDFNRFFEGGVDNADSEKISCWKLSYEEDEPCTLTIFLEGIRRYTFRLSDVLDIHLKQRDGYIKLLLGTKKECVDVEKINTFHDNKNALKKPVKASLVVIDIPLYAMDMAIQIAAAFKHAVHLCSGIENF